MKVFHQDRARKRMAVGVLAASMLASVLGLAPSAHAATTVYFVDDCSEADFVKAVEVANADADINTIVLEKGCTYEFDKPYFDPASTNSALPPIEQSLTIYGKGAKAVYDVDDDAEPYSSFRFLRNNPGDNPNITIRDLTVSGFEIFKAGATLNADEVTSGCILNEGTGTLTLRNSTVKNCEVFVVDLGAAVALSGAVTSVGNLVLSSSTVSGSEATAIGALGGGVVLGGGIVTTGALNSLSSSTVKGNRATGASLTVSIGGGGGIVSTGELNVSSSTISKNTASAKTSSLGIAIGAAGGMLLTAADNDITNSTVDGNKAKASGGVGIATAGGILNTGDLLVDTTGKSKITNNKAECDGTCVALGGGYANTLVGSGTGTATFNNTVFKGNVADGDDGVGLGGGLFLVGNGGPAETVLNNATVTKNTAKGDIWAAGGGLFTTDADNVDIDDSSFSKNKPENCFAFTGSLFCDL